jgi:RNA polymerase sigma-70 factor (ECF subfamily)
MDEGRQEREAAIRALCERRAYNDAVELTMEVYGSQLAKFVMAVLHRPELANDAFSCVCEKVVRNLAKFRWESSLRTWLYRIARNECMELLRSPARREELVSHAVPMDEAQQERSRTNPWMRTEVKEKFRALREQLSVQERMLLQLKVDQDLPWLEVAQILWEEEEGEPPPSRQALEKRAVALRQQFKRLKDRLKVLALEAGLIPKGPGDSGDSAESHTPERPPY